MRQQTFADEAFERYRNPTRREIFLGEMDKIIPWCELCEVIEHIQVRIRRPIPQRSNTPKLLRRRVIKTLGGTAKRTMKKTMSILLFMGFGIFSSFALASSQSDVNGSYIHKHKADVYDSDKEEWSSFETSDILVLKKTSERNLHFCFELYFTNGHQCVMEEDAKWVGQNRYEYLEQDAESRATECRLQIHVGTGMIKLQDMGAKCREKYCGARGVIDGVEFNRSSKEKEDLECGMRY